MRAIALLQQGLAPVEVARHVAVDRRSVRRWRASHDRAGRAGVGAKPAPGRPPKLEARGRARLERVLLRGAEAAGFSTPLWTCPRVADVVRREFGVRYHVDHIGQVLRTLGWSPQKPERRARERDEAAIQRWVKMDWPRLKKKPGARTPVWYSSTRAACSSLRSCAAVGRPAARPRSCISVAARATRYPPYAPELNPVEILWAYLKRNPLANFAALDAAHLAHVATRHVKRLRRRPELLRSFFDATPLFFFSEIGH